MTHQAEVNRLQNSLSRRGYKKPAVDPIEDAAIISEKVRGNGCLNFLGIGSAALLLVGLVAMAFGANARIKLRNGDEFQTTVSDHETPESLAHRMVSGHGWIVCTDKRWGKNRTIIQNMADVSTIVLEDDGVQS